MQTTLDALEAGAVSVITKPTAGVGGFLRESEGELLQAIRAYSSAWVPPVEMPMATNRSVVRAGMVIVQHMPEAFTRSFAERLDGLCQMEVREASTGDRILPGHALIAPGGKHTLVKRSGAQYRIEVVDGPLVSRHRPSVDVLFRSVAKAAGPNALGIIMTGMGDDGARGLKEMHDAGAHTVAQDEASGVVFGMPKEAIKHGGVRETLGLTELPAHIGRYGR